MKQPWKALASLSWRRFILHVRRSHASAMLRGKPTFGPRHDRRRIAVALSLAGLIALAQIAGSLLLVQDQANAVTITRVRSATGSNAGATSVAVTMPAAPADSNTLIAVIGTRGTTANRVSSVVQTGATWVRAISKANTAGTTMEIWYSNTLSSASASISFTLAASVKASVVVAEYSGISGLDQTASNASTASGTAATTGTTPATAQANELWIGGLDHIVSGAGQSYSLPTNSFSIVAQSQSTGGNASTRENSALLERVVTAKGTASTGATFSASTAWSGAIATFKARPDAGLAAYRFYANLDSTNVGTPLAAQNTSATLTSTGSTFRLRILLLVQGGFTLSSYQADLQYRAKGSACDSTGSWANVTSSSPIAFSANPTPANAVALTANASNDPTVASATIRDQTYIEQDGVPDFANSQLAINDGEYGKWDFSLKDNGASPNTTYCFRVNSNYAANNGTNLYYPELQTWDPAVPIFSQNQRSSTGSLLSVGATTEDGVGTPINLTSYMSSATPSQKLTPKLELRSTSTAFTNTATHTGTPFFYDPEVPIPNSKACSVYDSANQQMVIFGGDAGYINAPTNDVWVLPMKSGQRSQWEKITPGGTLPQTNFGQVCVYDALNSRMIVFGGYNNSTYLSGVWSLTLPTNGSTPTWSQLTTAGTAPNSSQVILAAAIYDPSPSRMIVFGGYAGTTDYATLSELTLPAAGTPTWRNITGSGPSPRDGSAFVYDDENNRAILFGGYKINPVAYYDDVWQLDLTTGSETWTQLTPTGTSPTARAYHFAVWQPNYDGSSADRMITFGGSTSSGASSEIWELLFSSSGGQPAWSLKGSGGSALGARYAGASPGIYDPATKRAIMPFGINTTNNLSFNEVVALDLDPASGDVPNYGISDLRGLRGRSSGAMIYDTSRSEMVLFGGAGRGLNTSYPDDIAETWRMNTSQTTPMWYEAGADITLPARKSGTGIYDAANDRAIYCTGISKGAIHSDCWQMTTSAAGKANWKRLSTSGTGPPALSEVTSVYDSANNRMVLYGGADVTNKSTASLYFLSLPTGGGTPVWTQPAVGGSGPTNGLSGASSLYDPARNRMLIFAGSSTDPIGNTATSRAVWELTLPTNGTPTWRILSPTGLPSSGGEGFSFTYDPDRGDGTPRAIAYLGGEVWELTLPTTGDGTWTQLSPAGTAPAARSNFMSAYDSANDRLIVYGGDNGSAFLNDSYSLSLGASPVWTQLIQRFYLPATIPVTGLTANTAYHWQSWYTGSTTGDSPKVSYGNNSETAADFTVVPPSNYPPNAPTGLAQKRTTGGAVVSAGGWTTENQITLTAQATDPDSSDSLQLCVEKQTLGTAFTGSGEICGTAVPYSGTAVTLSVNLTGLADGSYHWQARVKDSAGAYSSTGTTWTAYGNGSTRDFGVDTTPVTGNVYDGNITGVDSSFNNGALNQLEVNFQLNADASGLAIEEVGYGTTPGGTDISNGWMPFSPTMYAAGLTYGTTLQTGKIYYFTLRVTDGVGNVTVLNTNGQMVAPTLAFSVSNGTISLGRASSANGYTVSQPVTLTTQTNAKNGYQVYAKAGGLLTNSAAKTLGMFSGGSYASPGAWLTGATGFGYNSSDTSVGGSNRFNSATCPGGGGAPCFAPYSTSGMGDVVADGAGPAGGNPVNDSVTITNKAAIDSTTQQAGTYQTTIIYSAYATY